MNQVFQYVIESAKNIEMETVIKKELSKPLYKVSPDKLKLITIKIIKDIKNLREFQKNSEENLDIPMELHYLAKDLWNGKDKEIGSIYPSKKSDGEKMSLALIGWYNQVWKKYN
jgi:hypothetical protein